MKIKCKKCLIVYESPALDFTDVENYSTRKCGRGGTHVFVGVVG